GLFGGLIRTRAVEQQHERRSDLRLRRDLIEGRGRRRGRCARRRAGRRGLVGAAPARDEQQECGGDDGGRARDVTGHWVPPPDLVGVRVLTLSSDYGVARREARWRAPAPNSAA